MRENKLPRAVFSAEKMPLVTRQHAPFYETRINGTMTDYGTLKSATDSYNRGSGEKTITQILTVGNTAVRRLICRES